MVLNLSAFDSAIMSEIPFRYSIINGILDLTNVKLLYETVPISDTPLSLRKEGSDKTYQLHNCLLLDHVTGEIPPGLTLSPAWRNLINNFATQEYFAAVEKAIELDIKNCYLQIMLKLYRVDNYISMHTDDVEVAATHLVFLNPYYDFNNAGKLHFHDKEGKIVVRIPPAVELSVIFERSDCSWHSVEPCFSSELPKITLQIAFWKTRKQRELQGRYYDSLNNLRRNNDSA